MSGWRRYAWSPRGDLIGRGSLGWLGVLLRRASIAPPLRVRGRGRGRQRHLLLRRGRALARGARGRLSGFFGGLHDSLLRRLPLGFLGLRHGRGLRQAWDDESFRRCLGRHLARFRVGADVTHVRERHNARARLYDGERAAYRGTTSRTARRERTVRACRGDTLISSEFTTALSNLFPPSAASGRRSPRTMGTENSDRLFLGFDWYQGSAQANSHEIFTKQKSGNRHAAGEGCWQS